MHIRHGGATSSMDPSEDSTAEVIHGGAPVMVRKHPTCGDSLHCRLSSEVNASTCALASHRTWYKFYFFMRLCKVDLSICCMSRSNLSPHFWRQGLEKFCNALMLAGRLPAIIVEVRTAQRSHRQPSAVLMACAPALRTDAKVHSFGCRLLF